MTERYGKLFAELAALLSGSNPEYTCKVIKNKYAHTCKPMYIILFKCVYTRPHICKNIVVDLNDCNNIKNVEDLLKYIYEEFEDFRSECEQKRKNERMKIDYTQFYNVGAKSNGKTSSYKRIIEWDLWKEWCLFNVNSIYGISADIYNGGYAYPNVSREPNKDFPDVFRYCRNDVMNTIELFKEEFGMNTTKANKKQESDLREYDANTPYNYRPKKIIFNGPATIVIWMDDSKTVVKCSENEKYDKKLAFKYALHKRYVELHRNIYDFYHKYNNNYLRQFTKALEKTGDPQAAFVEVFAKIKMNDCTHGAADEYFKAIENHFKKEFES